MVASGHEVIGAAPEETRGVAEEMAKMKVRFAPVALSRTGLNPLVDGLSLLRLRTLYKRERPDMVLSYTIKPVVLGSLAASSAGVPHIYALITGLGAAFHTGGKKGLLLRLIAIQVYRVALARCEKVFVQNQEIADLFARENMVRAEKIVIVRGSGVDTVHFAFCPLPAGSPVFLFLGRMLRDKGVRELVAAARLVKAKIPEARFILVGQTDPNPACLSEAELGLWRQEGIVECFPFQDDVRPYLRDCSVLVLPSYHEGLPRSVLEAMSTGRAVITTDTIGCRETVANASTGAGDQAAIRRGRNGFLVPTRDVESLAAAMELLARDRPLAEAMGLEGRRIAQDEFDVEKVNASMLKAMMLA
jgi:glycosyltransferase involved in cell wall biosynthesis